MNSSGISKKAEKKAEGSVGLKRKKTVRIQKTRRPGSGMRRKLSKKIDEKLNPGQKRALRRGNTTKNFSKTAGGGASSKRGFGRSLDKGGSRTQHNRGRSFNQSKNSARSRKAVNLNAGSRRKLLPTNINQYRDIVNSKNEDHVQWIVSLRSQNSDLKEKLKK